MICVVVLQNSMDCVEGEIAEALSFPPIKTEPEVKLWGIFCKVVVAHAY